MKKVICGVLIAVAVVFPCAAQTKVDKLTKQRVQAVVDDIITSVVKKDLPGFLKHISPDALVVMKMAGKGGKKGRVIKMNKWQYAAALSSGFKSKTDYQYKVSNIEIVVDQDGRGATVTDVATEKVVQGGVKVDAKLFETTIFELTNGRPLVTFLYGRVGG